MSASVGVGATEADSGKEASRAGATAVRQRSILTVVVWVTHPVPNTARP